MAELKSAFSRDDIEVLIDAMSDWESIGNHEYHVMQMVKSHPMPDTEDESFEFVKNIKEHFKKREKEIKSERIIRQEKAILVKAKLVLLRQEGGITQLFEVAAESAQAEAAPKAVALSEVQMNRLEAAEYFIKDMKLWEWYEKFLTDRGITPKMETMETMETKEEPEKQTDTDDNDDEWFHGGTTS